ncbi:MAG: glycosyltransferase family A protein [Gammaproteobacteria bacterium]
MHCSGKETELNDVLVTVIIPAYNREKTVTRCLKSAMAQTHANLEILVIDDGSSDSTANLVRDLARSDERVRLIMLEYNKGAQHARNKGIQNARGAWIAFLDSDDYFLCDSVEKRLACAMEENVVVVHSECLVIRKNDELKRFNIKPLSGYVYSQLLEGPSPMFQGLLVEKQALQKIGMLDESILSYQEWDTSIRLAREFPFAFVGDPTFVYDCTGNDTISNNMRRDAQGYCQVFNKFRTEIKNNNGHHSLVAHYAFISSRYKRANAPAQALKYKLLSSYHSIRA